MLTVLSAGCAHAATAVRGLAVALAAIGGIAVNEAAAGDVARPELIGFSPDGRYVAYEDYGSEGEGFPYSSIYVIDAAANDWVPGSPIHVELEYEDLIDWEGADGGLSLARDRAMAQAQPVLDQYDIVAGEVGTTLIYHPLSDVNAPTNEVQFSIDAAFTSYVQGLHTLYLNQQEVRNDACDQYDLGPVAVMALALQSPREDSPIALQIDETLPDSRRCVSSYRIHSVIVYAPNRLDQSSCCPRGDLTLLVLVETAGWGPDHLEGLDYRHIGVTAMLHDAW